MSHACDPSTEEAEQEDFCEFKPGLRYSMRSWLKISMGQEKCLEFLKVWGY